MSVITGNPIVKTRGQSSTAVAGSSWFESIATQWTKALTSGSRNLTLNLGNIDFVPLYEWTSTVALIEKALLEKKIDTLGLDLTGNNSGMLLLPDEYIQRVRGQKTKRLTTTEQEVFSKRVYNIAGFLESLSSYPVLNANTSNRRASFFYKFLSQQDASTQQFYGGADDNETVLLGLTRIGTKDDCRQFLEQERITKWRRAMEDRFSSSPLFASEELWRVFCYELAANIWEHSNTSGFLSGRIVVPYDRNDKIKQWCSQCYPACIKKLFKNMRSGFIELCVTDAGEGIPRTLRGACETHPQVKGKDINDIDVLRFAFDEFGSCKTRDGSWVVERHALARTLQLVAKYGGSLNVRSGRGEVTYTSCGGEFARLPDMPGYQATNTQEIAKIPGTHFQLILPIEPLTRYVRKEQHSRLSVSLPSSFPVENEHVRGHLVPLLEKLDFPVACVGPTDYEAFRRACNLLCKELATKRPPKEPLVFDFSGLAWSAAQLETFLHFLQSVIQVRPALLVEVEKQLLDQASRLEGSAAQTKLGVYVTRSVPGFAGNLDTEVSEDRYLGTYNLVHSTILALDKNGEKYILGLADRKYEQILLSLIDHPKSLAELCRSSDVDERVFRSILNAINPLFEQVGAKWQAVWDSAALQLEANRVMSMHFDEVVASCYAWRGRRHKKAKKQKSRFNTAQQAFSFARDSGDEIFNLPWQEEEQWAEEFFECARILARERYADEAAQRLIYRLTKGLPLLKGGKSIEDVKVLACATAPALLLASAIHRWWPCETRPSVADLGYYAMLNPEQDLPEIPGKGDMIIVQDVLNNHEVSGRLMDLLKQQDKNVLCVLALAELVPDLTETRATLPDEWKEGRADLPVHALIQLRRPVSHRTAPSANEAKAFWVEPRTLRPFTYEALRREHKGQRNSEFAEKERFLKEFYEPEGGSILASGHYVYGCQHYTVAIDVQRALRGEIGTVVGNWLAGVCEGRQPDKKALWESDEGYSLHGDVTAVLMPLHSQIHYLWPKVENLLALRGRRQPIWFLDATLFLGHGPNYRIPLQLERQIEMAIRAANDHAESKKTSKFQGLRLLVLDDAVISARTIQTILATLDRAIRKAYKRVRKKPPDNYQPVEWIRYFCVFNQMAHSHSAHWHNLRMVGSEHKIPFVFEEFGHFAGLPVYDAASCPACRDRERLIRLQSHAQDRGMVTVSAWAEKQAGNKKPIAIDGCDFNTIGGKKLKKPIDLLPATEGTPVRERFLLSFADSAIWRFYELMYLSYPPGDLLRALETLCSTDEKIEAEYARYRWVVYEWCLRNWPRVLATASKKPLFECLGRELKTKSSIVPQIFEGMAQHSTDSHVAAFIGLCIENIGDIEAEQDREDEEASPTLLLLNKVLGIYCLSTDVHASRTVRLPGSHETVSITEALQAVVDNKDLSPGSFTMNLLLLCSKPKGYADPEWALRTVCENLLRGRDPSKTESGSHFLLPRLVEEVLDDPNKLELRALLESSLSVFLAALNDLSPYMSGEITGTQQVNDDGRATLTWLSEISESEQNVPLVDELRYLADDLLLTSRFSKALRMFHQPISEIRVLLKQLVDKLESEYKPRLQFDFPVTDIEDRYVLTHIHRFIIFLKNWMVDPIRNYPEIESHKASLQLRPSSLSGFITFRILTSYADPFQTKKAIQEGANYEEDKTLLSRFGVCVNDNWQTPSPSEQSDGFKSAVEINVPTGFVPKEKK